MKFIVCDFFLGGLLVKVMSVLYFDNRKDVS